MDRQGWVIESPRSCYPIRQAICPSNGFVPLEEILKGEGGDFHGSEGGDRSHLGSFRS
jgi:hypothetical protein